MKTDNFTEDRAIEIEEHVKTCPSCSRKARRLDTMIQSLGSHKEVFCPPPWMLYEYAQGHDDPEQVISRHLQNCPSCRKTVDAFVAAQSQEIETPERLMEAFRAKYQKPAVHVKLHDFLSNLFNFPVMAFAAVAAVILIVVLLYPRGQVEPRMALSPVSWEPKIILMAPASDKPKIALIIYTKGFDEPWPQERIDKLYKSMKPPKSVRNRVKVLSPVKVLQSIGKEPESSQRTQLLKKLYADLDASAALLVTIAPHNDRLTVEQELLDNESGNTLGKTAPQTVNPGDLAARLWDSALPLLPSATRSQ
jgi:hypothetical protein